MSRQSQKVETTKLLQAARKAAKRAYAPYSTAHIGAALMTEDGKIFSGCNIENSSYGATICAERVAIFKAVSETENDSPSRRRKGLRIAAICVVSPGPIAWPPCGMCRQVLSEFAGPELQVHIATHSNKDGPPKTLKFGEIFPLAFGSEFLAPLAKAAEVK